MWKRSALRTAGWLALVLSMVACGVWSGSGAGRLEADQGPAAEGTPTPPPAAALPDLGPAPEIHNDVWLNTDRPLRLADLEGKVVLIEFWTFG